MSLVRQLESHRTPRVSMVYVGPGWKLPGGASSLIRQQRDRPDRQLNRDRERVRERVFATTASNVRTTEVSPGGRSGSPGSYTRAPNSPTRDSTPGRQHRSEWTEGHWTPNRKRRRRSWLGRAFYEPSPFGTTGPEAVNVARALLHACTRHCAVAG